MYTSLMDQKRTTDYTSGYNTRATTVRDGSQDIDVVDFPWVDRVMIVVVVAIIYR